MRLSLAITYSWCNSFVGGKDWGERRFSLEVLDKKIVQQHNCAVQMYEKSYVYFEKSIFILEMCRITRVTKLSATI